MGESGGRSGGNALGRGASRRATPRERSYIDPPRVDDRESFEMELPGITTRRVVAWGVWAGAGISAFVGLQVLSIWVARVLGII